MLRWHGRNRIAGPTAQTYNDHQIFSVLSDVGIEATPESNFGDLTCKMMNEGPENKTFAHSLALCPANNGPRKWLRSGFHSHP